MPEILDVLIKSRNTIANPENWCINVFSQTTPQGISYCSRGAILNALGHSGYNARQAHDELYCRELAKSLPTEYQKHTARETVAQYNNKHSHAEVLAMFDITIKRLEGETNSVEYDGILMAA